MKGGSNMAENKKNNTEIWEDDGFLDLTAEEIRSATIVRPIEIEEITDNAPSKTPEEPYRKRGNKRRFK